MQQDVVSELGYVFLGSRLKRLGERMQVGAARVIASCLVTTIRVICVIRVIRGPTRGDALSASPAALCS